MYLPPPFLPNPTSPSSILNPSSYPCGPWYWIPIDHGTGRACQSTGCARTHFHHNMLPLEGRVFLRIGAVPSVFSHQTQMDLFRNPREGLLLFYCMPVWISKQILGQLLFSIILFSFFSIILFPPKIIFLILIQILSLFYPFPLVPFNNTSLPMSLS